MPWFPPVPSGTYVDEGRHDVLLTIPRVDLEEARRRGYTTIRVMLACGTDGHVLEQRTQVRTGFNPETGAETWEDLYPREEE